MYYIIVPLILSFIIAILLGHKLIPFLKSKKLGQKILEIGPRWHKSKEGTPVMGGLLFISGSLLSVLIFGIWSGGKPNYAVIYTYIMAFCHGIIGFADDYVKLFRKQNEGLTKVQKLALQFPISIIYVVLLRYQGIITTELVIPFVNINADMGIFYYIFIVIGMVYIINSVNFTDGIDGLCGSVTSVIMIMYILLFYIDGESSGLVLASSCLGGLLGFLYFNFNPARVFMGDTGSLFLGGTVTGIAVWMRMPLLLVLFGIVYVMESVSVIIQVTSFKLTGKRVFKMSPIHHHFEMCGWSENKIVSVAVIITVVMSALSALGKIK